MNPTDKKSDIPARVEQEHAHLRRALEELRASASSVAEGEDFAQWRLELMWQVRDFKNDLLKHFDLEEEGGFMRDVRRQVPNSDPQVNELLEEHREMELTMDRVLVTLKAMRERDDQELTRLQQEIDEFISTALEHETTEQHLLQRSYYRDYGGPE